MREGEAAASAALAAQYAKDMAKAYEEIVKIKADLIDALAKAQDAAQRAEQERIAAEEAQRAAEQAALTAAKYSAMYELADLLQAGEQLTGHSAADYAEIVEAARAAVDAAQSAADVEAAMAEAREALSKVGCPSEAFADVLQDTWYHEGVDAMVAAGYMNGVAADRFDVNGSLTRAQLVTVLYRIAGEPETKAENPFTDVPAGKWYSNAIVWAAENGIVNGISATEFAPNNAITREQIAAILYRYAKAEPAEEGKLDAFSDAANVSNYARQAMNWAVAEGLINGANGKLLPRDTATRAQIAVILTRYLCK